MNKYIRINELDNVIVALTNLKSGDNLDGIVLKEDIKKGYKIATKDINKDEDVIKYGTSIGLAKDNIKQGSLVHTHNLKTNIKEEETYEYNPLSYKSNFDKDNVIVNVFKRNDGHYGIRNNLLIMPLVGCVNSIASKIKEEVNKLDIPYVDNVIALNHPYGCSQLNDDLKNTKETLASLALNPNFGGVLVISLGCENNKLEEFKKSLGKYDSDRIKFITIQESKNEIEESLLLIKEILNTMEKDKRIKTSLSSICLGMKCGGSDAFSGITANPLLGYISDYIVSNDGSIILTEIPEMFGVERELLNRSEKEEVFNKFVSLINDFKTYYKSHNQVCYENPSPGNIEGGISTLEDKSAGCIRKGGYSLVTDILRMNEKVKTSGLNILEGPGNDMVSSTLLAASNANMILFTTGRGTPFGSIVPTLKISTNKELSEKKENWIDYDASRVFEIGFVDAFIELKDLVIKTINGEYKTKNEVNQNFDIAIFKDGVIL